MTQLQPAEITAVIGETRRLVVERYVFPEVGAQLAALLDDRLAAGRYHQAADPAELGRLATEDLQSVNNDRHLRLKFHPRPIPDGADGAVLAEMTHAADLSLGGVPKIERLAGGVALLELAPILFPLSMTGESVTAALNLVARAEALVIDLRACVGGHPNTVAQIASYLLDQPTHLNTLYDREDDDYIQFWSLPYVPGAKFGGEKPLYLLTSRATFSGGEELTYDLQQLGRAVVVGERTGGGANPRQGFTVHPHLEATIPVARAINPTSGDNWEGTGITPDIETAPADALDVAYRAALAAVAARDVDSPSADEARRAVAALTAPTAATGPDASAARSASTPL
ncbi:S41 family peptidase [Kitasatospora mediocidica]|uniref:S41 family peptidase n=1 Tax=Kitasatospora mediocidica TaxID=58352 RepID=UPI000691C508|nr:S41 family peptidase [Kitasatospora mediocidica]